MRRLLPIFAVFTLFLAPLAQANEADFATWLGEFKRQAAQAGIRGATLDAALTDIEPDERVIELDRKQPESTLTFAEYRQKAVSKKRIEDGRVALSENRTLLEEAAAKYGVEPRFIVALWGVETSYGENTGGFDIVPSLATLAYDGRRSEFFRGELLKALHIVDGGHIALDEMTGSWAGAMGQCQFMPSSFIRFAVDGDGDGKRDIWNTEADIFASIAHYLAASGWDKSEGWGQEALVPVGFTPSHFSLTQTHSLAEWKKLGVKFSGDSAAPETQASLIRAGDGEGAPAYLVYGNYKVLLKWNRSRYFATSVGLLADEIGN